LNPLIENGKKFVVDAERILVFSGAGLSTESGIPDFRSPGGLWSKYNPADFYFDKIISDKNARIKYWRMSSESYRIMRDAEPNPAHMAIKPLEDMGKLLCVVTQNIDSLHHRAGNSPEKIIEIHGTAFSVSCLKCGKSYNRDDIERSIDSGLKDPLCDECSGILKPDTISFGQAMPEDKMARAIKYAGDCDFCIALGSSLIVYPAASVPSHAAKSGAKLMIINREETPLDSMADLVIHGSVSNVLNEIISA
jgi:NAD-dependent deacetylase